MSHYKPYPVYRDSGVEWIGQVPEHWSVKPVYSVASLRNGFPFKADLFSKEGEKANRVLRIRDIVGDDEAIYSDERCPEWAEIKNGDILIGMDGDFNVHRWERGAARLNQRMCAINGYTEVISCLLNHSLALPLKVINDLAYTTTVKHLSSYEVLHTRIPLPPQDELDCINKMLGHETARIDALITKKTRFIELLKEKRQALITHAVTKGLDPKVKMKESGVEWIGEIPEHWAVCKLSYRYSVELGKMLDEKRITGEHPVPYLRNKDVQWGEINTADLPVMDISPDEIERYTIKNGDLLVCEGGDVGRAAIWRGNNNVIGYQKALHRLRGVSSDKDSVEFYEYVLGAAKRNGVFEESDAKSTISHLPAEKFREYRFAFPPLTEQAEIVTSLNRDTGLIDLLTEKTQRSIDLLKERRAAFITAAVTGQIDLRESA